MQDLCAVCGVDENLGVGKTQPSFDVAMSCRLGWWFSVRAVRDVCGRSGACVQAKKASRESECYRVREGGEVQGCWSGGMDKRVREERSKLREMTDAHPRP